MMNTHTTRDSLTWTEILTFNFWKVEENQYGELFLTPSYPASSPEPRSQFATVYSNGTVAYGFPEDVPQYVKHAINLYVSLKQATGQQHTEKGHTP